MNNSVLIKNGSIVNEGQVIEGDLLIKDGRIEQVGGIIESENVEEVDAYGMFVLPGLIDDQVHFREPGLTHKADIGSESYAALMGGVTSFMEMPNTKPSALTQELLQDKYDIAARTSYSNYSFFMGASNDNIEEVLKTDPRTVCGIKVFMGSSTGNMLVDDRQVLEAIFSQVPFLIATHCEDEDTILKNLEDFKRKYGDEVTADMHPLIRSVEGCLLSSSLAVELAKKHQTRLHILHISTEDELALFRNDIPLTEKKITAEVCVHHLYFDATDYATLGNRVKCNPAIKAPQHKRALFEGLMENRLDIIATDHAPHTADEKDQPYLQAPSGLPLVQHSLNIMMEFYQQGRISIQRVVEKMSHAPADCFDIVDRGYLREGYQGDVIIYDPETWWTVAKNNIHYKCGWSPLENKEFKGRVRDVFLNGQHAVKNGRVQFKPETDRLQFDRSI